MKCPNCDAQPLHADLSFTITARIELADDGSYDVQEVVETVVESVGYDGLDGQDLLSGVTVSCRSCGHYFAVAADNEDAYPRIRILRLCEPE